MKKNKEWCGEWSDRESLCLDRENLCEQMTLEHSLKEESYRCGYLGKEIKEGIISKYKGPETKAHLACVKEQQAGQCGRSAVKKSNRKWEETR